MRQNTMKRMVEIGNIPLASGAGMMADGRCMGQSGELRLARVLLKNLQNPRIRAPGTKKARNHRSTIRMSREIE